MARCLKADLHPSNDTETYGTERKNFLIEKEIVDRVMIFFLAICTGETNEDEVIVIYIFTVLCVQFSRIVTPSCTIFDPDIKSNLIGEYNDF